VANPRAGGGDVRWKKNSPNDSRLEAYGATYTYLSIQESRKLPNVRCKRGMVVNDVSAFRDPAMVQFRGGGLQVCIMQHARHAETTQVNPVYVDVVGK